MLLPPSILHGVVHSIDHSDVTDSMESAGSGSRALFPKGPSFTLEDFSNKDFIVRDFVDSLAENAVSQNRRSGTAQQAFDPKPLIRAFESITSTTSLRLGDALLTLQPLRCAGGPQQPL